MPAATAVRWGQSREWESIMSVEDYESLQERWAALLANAADPKRDGQVLPSFVEILKELTPDETLS